MQSFKQLTNQILLQIPEKNPVPEVANFIQQVFPLLINSSPQTFTANGGIDDTSINHQFKEYALHISEHPSLKVSNSPIKLKLLTRVQNEFVVGLVNYWIEWCCFNFLEAENLMQNLISLYTPLSKDSWQKIEQEKMVWCFTNNDEAFEEKQIYLVMQKSNSTDYPYCINVSHYIDED